MAYAQTPLLMCSDKRPAVLGATSTGPPASCEGGQRKGQPNERPRRQRNCNEDRGVLRPGAPQGVGRVDEEGGQRENQHHAIKRRSGELRPTLRKDVGQHKPAEGSEHPTGNKYYEELFITTLTGAKHQADRAHGPSQHREQRHPT